MAANMTRVHSILLVLGLALSFNAAAELLSDPTKPPAEIGEGSNATLLPVHVMPANSKGLLSVIVSPTRCAAIIDGKSIRLGEKYGDAILVEVTPHGVVLQDKQGRHSMELFPRVGVNVTAAQPVQQSASCKLEQNFEREKPARLTPALKEKK